MNELPTELLELIIEYCELAEALAFNLICKNCVNLVNNNLQYRLHRSYEIPERFRRIQSLYIDFSQFIMNGFLLATIHFDNWPIKEDKPARYDSIAKLSNLKKLIIEDDADFSDITLSKLLELETLIIHNAPKISDDAVSRLLKLRILRIAKYNRNITNNSIEKLLMLTSLDIRDNYTISIPPLTCLKKIHISTCQKIPKQILSNLEEIVINYDKYITDDILIQMSNLTSLNLWSNIIITNAGLSKMTKMKVLHLSEKITNTSLLNMTKLRVLYLDNNTNISNSGLINLQMLTKLSMGNNNNISDQMLAKMINLNSLYLDNNEQVTDAGLSKLINLRVLKLGHCIQITNLSMSKLLKLETLSLDSNINITNVPYSLKNFYVEDNKNFSENILPKMKNLKVLECININVTDTSISQLIGLVSLRFDNKNGKVTDFAISKLKKLRHLTIYNNKSITQKAVSGLPYIKSVFSF